MEKFTVENLRVKILFGVTGALLHNNCQFSHMIRRASRLATSRSPYCN